MRSYLLAKQMLIKAKRMTMCSKKKDIIHAATLQIPRWLLHCAFLGLLIMLVFKRFTWKLMLLLFLVIFIDVLILPTIGGVVRKKEGIRMESFKVFKLFVLSCTGASVLFFCDYFALKHNLPVSAGIVLLVGSVLLLLTIMFFSYATCKTVFNMELYDLYNISQVAYYSFFLGKIIRSILGCLFVPLVYDYLLDAQFMSILEQYSMKNEDKNTITFHAINI